MKPVRTAPIVPPDEVPLDPAFIERFLEEMGKDVILVGGQALALWMARYGIAPDTALISNDGDVLGTREEAAALARKLGAVLVVPANRARTVLTAQVRKPTEDSKYRNIDFLHVLYAYTKSLRGWHDFTAKVRARAVLLRDLQGHEFRVMHPLDVLESRVHNAAGLLVDKGPHVLTQAQWAIVVAKEALSRIGRDEASRSAGERSVRGLGESATKTLGGHMQEIVTLSKSAAAKALRKVHGLCVLQAIPLGFIEATPELRQRYARQIPRVRAEIERQTAPVKPK